MSGTEERQTFDAGDERFMRRALALAEKGRGSVEPNPMVGCVLVRDGRVVGEGYHRRFGGPHAEVEALHRAGEEARGATVYVTLEPCCHTGKTGPCTRALRTAGVARVVAAMADPFPRVAGGGLAELREGGIEVATGLLEGRARALNAAYLKRLATGTPWVILKWAQSLDGKLATSAGHSQWITSDGARKEAHRLRGYVDGVIVGVGTVHADDPQLTCRMVRPRRVARRIVVDGRLSVPLYSQLVHTARQVPTAIVCTERVAGEHAEKVAVLRDGGCELVVLPEAGPGRVDLRGLLGWCGSQQMTNVMVEGGGHLLGQFLDEGLADEVAVFVAPMVIGGGAPAAVRSSEPGAPMLQAVTPWPGGVQDLSEAPHLLDVRVRRLGPDLEVRGKVKTTVTGQ